MAPSTNDRRSPQRPPQPDRAERDSARPFDSRELEKLPPPTDQDPPYRPWWVIERG